MEKINVAELLKDCPSGMELDCAMFENVTFVRVDMSRKHFPIEIAVGGIRSIYLNKEGCFHNTTLSPESKCVIFPKGKTTWEGFVPPCKFKDGDILTYTSIYTTTFIYRNKDNEPKFSTSFYVACNNAPSHNFLIYNKHTLIALDGNCDVCLATDEEKQKLFDAIKANGYKWNAETKTLEKLHEPKFRVGYRVKSKINQYEYTIADIIKDAYVITYGTSEYGYHVPFYNEDNFELVSNKFDVNTLKPFEKVLVRLTNGCVWTPKFFSHYDTGPNVKYYPFVTIDNIGYPQCIPYNDDTKHLLGKTDNCDEYYKTWE